MQPTRAQQSRKAVQRFTAVRAANALAPSPAGEVAGQSRDSLSLLPLFSPDTNPSRLYQLLAPPETAVGYPRPRTKHVPLPGYMLYANIMTSHSLTICRFRVSTPCNGTCAALTKHTSFLFLVSCEPYAVQHRFAHDVACNYLFVHTMGVSADAAAQQLATISARWTNARTSVVKLAMLHPLSLLLHFPSLANSSYSLSALATDIALRRHRMK